MTDINSMLDKRETQMDSNEEFDLIVRNGTDYKVFYTQPCCTAETTIQDIINNGDFPENLGIDMKKDLRFKRARSKDQGLVPPELLSVAKGDVRAATLGELGFNMDGYDTLIVNTEGDNG